MLNFTAVSFALLILNFYFISTEAGGGRILGLLGLKKRNTQEEGHWGKKDYSNVEYGKEEMDRSKLTKKFKLEKAKSKIIAILREIDDDLSTYINYSGVQNAEDIDDLITEANKSLTDEQDTELTELDLDERNALLKKLDNFFGDFSAYLERTGYGDVTAPFTYLEKMIKDSIEKDEAAPDLEHKSKMIKTILDEIENYLPTYINRSKIENATNVYELIKAADSCLTENQKKKLLKLNLDERRALLNKLDNFMSRFSIELNQTGYEDSKVPLVDLYDRIQESIEAEEGKKKEIEEVNEENDGDHDVNNTAQWNYSNPYGNPHYGSSSGTHYGDSTYFDGYPNL